MSWVGAQPTEIKGVSREELLDYARKRMSKRIELKKIEDKIQRQIEFSKRRNKLLRKAYEVSVLCDVEVAIILFSPRGRLYAFSSAACMEKTFQRYRRCYQPQPQPDNITAVLLGRFNGETMEAPQSSAVEMNKNDESHKLYDSVASLQCLLRNLVKENLGALATAELEELESQLDSSLKHIRDVKECRARDVSGKLSQLALEEGSGSGDAPKMGASSSRARL